MTTTFRVLGLAASLVMGTALAASAAVPSDNQGVTTTKPGASSYSTSPTGYGTSNQQAGMTPGYHAPTPSDQVNNRPATAAPQVTSGNTGGDNGPGGGGGAGGAGGGAGGNN